MMKKTIVLIAFLALVLSLSSSVNLSNKSFAPRIRLKNGTSTNWSGYAVQTNLTNPQSNAVTNVQGTWVVPSLTCGLTNTYSSAWVGIDGYSDGTVEQTGTEHDCNNGVATYSAWYEMYPKPARRINLPVSVGDTIFAQVAFLGKNQFRLTLTNVTKNVSFATTQKTNAQRSSAEWIMEAPWSGGVLPLSNFGTIQFASSSATVNGVAGTINNPNWKFDRIDMTDSSGNLKASTSSLSPDGSAFSVGWVAN